MPKKVTSRNRLVQGERIHARQRDFVRKLKKKSSVFSSDAQALRFIIDQGILRITEQRKLTDPPRAGQEGAL